MKKTTTLALAFLLSFALVAQVDLQQGLVGFWQLDNNALDSSGLHNGTIVGTAPTMDRCGNEQGAMSFPRVDNSIILFGDIFDNVFAGAGQQFSFSAWIKPPATQVASMVVWAKTADSGCNRNERQVACKLYNGHLLLWYSGDLGPAGSRGVQANSLVNDPNAWYHVVCVYDGTQNGNNGLDRINIYINNQLQSKTLSIIAGVNGDIPAGPAPFSIGAYANSDDVICLTNQIFEGGIDEFRLYDRMLNADDVDALFHYGCPVPNSIPTIGKQNITIYPNPSEGIFILQSEAIHTDGQVEVFDLNGQVVLSRNWSNGMEINLQQFPAGMYFVRVSWDDGQQYTGKILSMKSRP